LLYLPRTFRAALVYRQARSTVIEIRRTCCLRYRLDRPRYCYLCPLVTTEERIALLRERLED
jgi:hypothetical protein